MAIAGYYKTNMGIAPIVYARATAGTPERKAQDKGTKVIKKLVSKYGKEKIAELGALIEIQKTASGEKYIFEKGVIANQRITSPQHAVGSVQTGTEYKAEPLKSKNRQQLTEFEKKHMLARKYTETLDLFPKPIKPSFHTILAQLSITPPPIPFISSKEQQESYYEPKYNMAKGFAHSPITAGQFLTITIPKAVTTLVRHPVGTIRRLPSQIESTAVSLITTKIPTKEAYGGGLFTAGELFGSSLIFYGMGKAYGYGVSRLRTLGAKPVPKSVIKAWEKGGLQKVKEGKMEFIGGETRGMTTTARAKYFMKEFKNPEYRLPELRKYPTVYHATETVWEPPYIAKKPTTWGAPIPSTHFLRIGSAYKKISIGVKTWTKGINPFQKYGVMTIKTKGFRYGLPKEEGYAYITGFKPENEALMKNVMLKPLKNVPKYRFTWAGKSVPVTSYKIVKGKAVFEKGVKSFKEFAKSSGLPSSTPSLSPATSILTIRQSPTHITYKYSYSVFKPSPKIPVYPTYPSKPKLSKRISIFKSSPSHPAPSRISLIPSHPKPSIPSLPPSKAFIPSHPAPPSKPYIPPPSKPFIPPPSRPQYYPKHAKRPIPLPTLDFRLKGRRKKFLKFPRRPTKYSPSLLGLMSKKTIFKAPKMVTGLGIRYPLKKTKVKKKRKKKRRRR